MEGSGAPENGQEIGPERSPGQIDNPEISARFQAKQAEKAAAQAESLSIAQRLSRRGQTETVKIPFNDDLGEFIVEVRLPTTAEMNELMKFDKMVTASKGNNEEIDAATDKHLRQLSLRILSRGSRLLRSPLWFRRPPLL